MVTNGMNNAVKNTGDNNIALITSNNNAFENIVILVKNTVFSIIKIIIKANDVKRAIAFTMAAIDVSIIITAANIPKLMTKDANVDDNNIGMDAINGNMFRTNMKPKLARIIIGIKTTKESIILNIIEPNIEIPISANEIAYIK